MFFEQSLVRVPLVMNKMTLSSTEHCIQLNHIAILFSNVFLLIMAGRQYSFGTNTFLTPL